MSVAGGIGITPSGRLLEIALEEEVSKIVLSLEIAQLDSTKFPTMARTLTAPIRYRLENSCSCSVAIALMGH